MIKDILYVGLGGFIGSVLRYMVSLAMRSAGAFPWGTFTVNIAGCLLIGLITGLAGRHTGLPNGANLFLTVGLCGGFTTFSTYSREALTLLQQGHTLVFVLYAAGSVVMGLLAVALGLWLTH